VLGIWLPSVDKAGRYSPLTIAATAPDDWAPSVGAMTAFLAAAEQAGCDTLEHDLAPADLLQRIQDAFIAADVPAPAPDLAPGRAAWWTEGGPRVAPRLETATALPEGSRFAALIDDDWGQADPPAELATARTDPS
jgi:type VI secretion system protein ImpM